MGVWILIVLLAGARLWAQAPEDAIRAAMEGSLAKQRASVRNQVSLAIRVESTGSGQADFFTVPWPKPVAMLAADCDPLGSSKVEELISQASKREGVQSEILRQVMQRESAFRPCAVSVKGAQGLMQLMPATAQQFGVRDPFDPEQNIGAGAKFLKQLLARYNGDLGLALAAYNAGPGNVDKVGGVPDIPETKAYVSEILKRVLL